MSAGSERGWLLVVDDEPALANLLKIFLERAGYRVTVSHDPLLALQAFSQDAERYAALIVDLVLPNMNGEELVVAVRKTRPDIPAVITSGYPHQTRLAHARFLQKPFPPKELVEVLEEILG